jgi:hypothetical protein
MTKTERIAEAIAKTARRIVTGKTETDYQRAIRHTKARLF